eukprot:GHVR01089253.1.p1 GENE.GHVR01089253.1~~GHVR01089253.1.p1  ORF type:complete len:161 (+),score=84.11 GHVR01089253.1:2-484(+)
MKSNNIQPAVYIPNTHTHTHTHTHTNINIPRLLSEPIITQKDITPSTTGTYKQHTDTNTPHTDTNTPHTDACTPHTDTVRPHTSRVSPTYYIKRVQGGGVYMAGGDANGGGIHTGGVMSSFIHPNKQSTSGGNTHTHTHTHTHKYININKYIHTDEFMSG